MFLVVCPTFSSFFTEYFSLCSANLTFSLELQVMPVILRANQNREKNIYIYMYMYKPEYIDGS